MGAKDLSLFLTLPHGAQDGSGVNHDAGAHHEVSESVKGLAGSQISPYEAQIGVGIRRQDYGKALVEEGWGRQGSSSVEEECEPEPPWPRSQALLDQAQEKAMMTGITDPMGSVCPWVGLR